MKNSAGTHRDVSQCFPSRCLALLDQVSSEMPGPPACVMETSGNAEPFGTVGDTHTHAKAHARTHFTYCIDSDARMHMLYLQCIQSIAQVLRFHV